MRDCNDFVYYMQNEH